MSDHQAALAHNAMAAAAVVARPRISADAFRNLTARLKKTDVSIPTLMPEPVAIVEPVTALAAIEPEIKAETADLPDSEPVATVDVTPVALAALQPLPETPPQQIAQLASESAPMIDVAPVAQSLAAQDTEILLQDVVSLDSPPEVAFAPSDEVAVMEPPAVIDARQPVSEVSPSQWFEPLPTVIAEVAPIPAPEAAPTAIVAEAVHAEAAAVEELSQDDIEPATAEPQLEGSFSENFTFVPEGGKSAAVENLVQEQAQSEPAGPDQTAEKDVAERSVQLQLENNWRLLLAKPTPEDRAIYLREAAEYHEFDEEWNKPAPEHDLSQIKPAQLENADAAVAEAPEAPGAMQRSLQDNLPVAEGQDLAELTRSLLDMMAAGNASGLPQERALAADTLLRLVPRLDLKPLVMLAQRLSIMDNPPHLLAARLIRDPRVEVAGPLLEDCAHLTDRDIESVVQEGEPAKLRMIARRRKLTRPISDALIKSGDPSVVLTLVRNMEAEISHDGFQSLLVLCENHEELLAPLATRHDMQAPFAFELFWLAPAQLRRFILSRFLTDSETLTKILKITMATQSEDDSENEPLSQHALLEALERAARGHIEVAADELAGIMQLSTATVTRILSDLQGDAIVVMLKAAGYPRSAVSGLLRRMQDADMPLVTRERDINELQSMFETLSFNKARILLTYWDWAQGKTGPYAPVH